MATVAEPVTVVAPVRAAMELVVMDEAALAPPVPALANPAAEPLEVMNDPASKPPVLRNEDAPVPPV